MDSRGIPVPAGLPVPDPYPRVRVGSGSLRTGTGRVRVQRHGYGYTRFLPDNSPLLSTPADVTDYIHVRAVYLIILM